jgi:hypothetical protein
MFPLEVVETFTSKKEKELVEAHRKVAMKGKLMMEE